MSSEESFASEIEENETEPCQASDIKIGDYLLIKGKPCKITHLTISKTGKHGHAKANVIGVDIFTGKKQDDSIPAHNHCEKPLVNKDTYELVNIEDGFALLQDQDGNYKEDVELPSEEQYPFVKDLKQKFDEGKAIVVNTIQAMGRFHIYDFRVDTTE